MKTSHPQLTGVDVQQGAEYQMILLFKILGVLFALFIVLFIAITVEESFFAGRRRRNLEKKAREAQRNLIE